MERKATKRKDDWERKFQEWKKLKEDKRTNEKVSPPDFHKARGKKIAIEDGIKKETKKSKGIEKAVIIFLYVIVLGVMAYFLIGNLVVPIDSGVYEINADDSLIGSNLKSLYIDKEIFGGKEQINGETVRQVTSSQTFNLVFNPKRVLESNTTGILELNFIGNATRDGSEVYLNEELIVPDLRDYALVKDMKNDQVWIRKDLLNYWNANSLKNAYRAEDFVYRNFPGASVYSFKELSPNAPYIADYSKDWITEIDTTFRDNLKLAVYVEGNLDISFTKQDLNNNLGKDEYEVTIENLNGGVVFSEIYRDEGDKKDSNRLGEEQDFKINLINLPKSVYYISFTKDAINKYSDSTIKNIKINSNKILIIDRFLPLEELDFYTFTVFPKTIGFYYWHNGKDQKISVSGVDSDTINLSENWKEKKYEYNLAKSGDHYIELEKGYLWITSDMVSPSKNSWFDLPTTVDDKFENQDIIVINKDKLEINSNGFSFKEEVILDSETKFEMKFLDENKYYLKNIKLTLE